MKRDMVRAGPAVGRAWIGSDFPTIWLPCRANDGETKAMKHHAAVPLLVVLLAACISAEPASGPATAPAFVPLFPDKGAPKGWSVRVWSDVGVDAPGGPQWLVDDA